MCKHKAEIDLDDDYMRELVAAAWVQQPKWKVTILSDTAGGAECARQQEKPCLFFWGEYERIDWELVQAGVQVASSYCIRKGLIRKAHLAYNTKKWVAKHPQGKLAGALPETWVLEVDDVDYIDEALSDVPEVRDMREGEEVWIAKPSLTNQALSVCIFDSVQQLRDALEAAPNLREWVLQRYIADPLLVGGRKFHIRAYVLCVGSLTAYAYSQTLALFARQQYPQGSSPQLGNLEAHLTNTCVHRRPPPPHSSSSEDCESESDASEACASGCPPEDSEERPAEDGRGVAQGDNCSAPACKNIQAGTASLPPVSGQTQDTEQPATATLAARPAAQQTPGTATCEQPPVRDCAAGDAQADTQEQVQADKLVWATDELPQLLSEDGMPDQEARERVEQLQQDVQSIIGETIEAVSSELSFFALPNCFELFGLDLLVDSRWHVWLLEANAEPDFAQTGGRLRGLVGCAVNGALQLVLDSLQLQQGGQGQELTARLEPPAHPSRGHVPASQGLPCHLTGEWVKVYQRCPVRG